MLQTATGGQDWNQCDKCGQAYWFPRVGAHVNCGGLPETDLTDVKFVIWNAAHHVWWRPANLGYTTNIEEAGRFSAEEAAKIHTTLGAKAYQHIAIEEKIAANLVYTLGTIPVPLQSTPPAPSRDLIARGRQIVKEFRQEFDCGGGKVAYDSAWQELLQLFDKLEKVDQP